MKKDSLTSILATLLIAILIILFLGNNTLTYILLGVVFVLYILRTTKRTSKTKQLLDVQNAISPVYSDTLTGSPKQIVKRFQTYLTNHTKELNNALIMLHNADNPKAYKDARLKYDKEIYALCQAEKQTLIPLNPLPSKIKKQFDQDEPRLINEMLSRMWQKYQEQALALKTQKGRRNHIKSYFEILSINTDMFYSENMDRIRLFYSQAIEKYGLEKQ